VPQRASRRFSPPPAPCLTKGVPESPASGHRGRSMATDATIPVPAAPLVPPMRGWLSFLRHFLDLAGGYWRGERKWHARALTMLLVLLTVGQVALAVALNHWIQALFDALEQ